MAIKDLLHSEKYLELNSQFPKWGRRKEKLIAALMANNPYPLKLSEPVITQIVCPEQYYIERYGNYEPDIKAWLYCHLNDLVQDEGIIRLFRIGKDRLSSWDLSELILRTQIALYDGWNIVNKSGCRIKGSDDSVDASSLTSTLSTAERKLENQFSIPRQHPYNLDYTKTILHFVRWGKPDAPPLWVTSQESYK